MGVPFSTLCNNQETLVNQPLIQRRNLVLGSMLLGSGVSALASKEEWPQRPIRLVVAGSAGAGGDVFARLVADPLSRALNQPVMVEPKAGANGLIAADHVAKAAPDGYTFLYAPSSTILINPVVHPKLPYDADKDLVPVVQVGAGGIMLVASPKSGFKNLADMVAFAKANPGKLAYGSWGQGSSGHLVMEAIKSHYGLDMPHAPYKSIVQEVTDLLGGNIMVGFTDSVSPVQHMRSGRLVGLGQSGSRRWPAMPDMPTLSEQGFKFDADGWYGVFAPLGTPSAVVDRLAQEINRVQQSSEFRQKLEASNMHIVAPRSAQDFAVAVKKDAAIWQPLAKAASLNTK
jgi:tripartite-type tricarboxylate transporter receptor subunit TctC